MRVRGREREKRLLMRRIGAETHVTMKREEGKKRRSEKEPAVYPSVCLFVSLNAFLFVSSSDCLFAVASGQASNSFSFTRYSLLVTRAASRWTFKLLLHLSFLSLKPTGYFQPSFTAIRT